MAEDTGRMVSADMARRAAANKHQVGGAHYQSDYQYWDFVRDVGLSYHAGNAGKYVSRAYKKNGAEDVQKGAHYVDKCDEIDDEGSIYSEMVCAPLIARFVVANGLDEKQGMALTAICQGDWEAARLWTGQLG